MRAGERETNVAVEREKRERGEKESGRWAYAGRWARATLKPLKPS